MSKSASFKPPGAHSVTPYITVTDSQKAIEFYKEAFGAEQRGQCAMMNGKCVHAEIQIGDSLIYLHDEMPDMCSLSPKSRGGSSVSFLLYFENVDPSFDKAVKAGCTVKMPLADQFWGDRYGVVEDPFGHVWDFAQHIEDVAPEDMKKRMDDAAKQTAGKS